MSRNIIVPNTDILSLVCPHLYLDELIRLSCLSRDMRDAMNDVDVYIKPERIVDRPKVMSIQSFDQCIRVTKMVASRYIFTIPYRSDDAAVISSLYKLVINNTNKGVIRWDVRCTDENIIPDIIPLINNAIELHIGITFPIHKLASFKHLRYIVLHIMKYTELVYDMLRCISNKSMFPSIDRLSVIMDEGDQDFDDIQEDVIDDMPYLSTIETVHLDLSLVYASADFFMSLAGIRNLRIDMPHKFIYLTELHDYYFLNHKCLIITSPDANYTKITTTNVSVLCVMNMINSPHYVRSKSVIHILDPKTRSFRLNHRDITVTPYEPWDIIDGKRCLGEKNRQPSIDDDYTILWMLYMPW